MGNDCSSVCGKKKKLSRKNTEENYNIAMRNSLASNRETINEFSLKNYQQVMFLANEGNLNGVKAYLDQGFVVDFPLDQSGWTLLHLACQKGNLKLVELLLRYKPYIDAQELAEGWSPLMVGTINNFDTIVRLLIQHGADEKLLDKSGKSIQDLATKYKSNKILDILFSSV